MRSEKKGAFCFKGKNFRGHPIILLSNTKFVVVLLTMGCPCWPPFENGNREGSKGERQGHVPAQPCDIR